MATVELAGDARARIHASIGVVLIVDDDDDIREALAELLDREGFATATARNGFEALAALDRLGPTPCVMLLDMMMPAMSGGQLLEVLDQTRRLDDLPVIILTASAATPSKALGVLRKPASLDAILGALSDGFRTIAERTVH